MRVLLLSALIVAVSAPVAAHPSGAPWGTSDPTEPEHCATCHFDGGPVYSSPALTIDGLPETVTPARIYDLTLTFAADAGLSNGFLLYASKANDPAGAFSGEGDGLETMGSSVRSIAPRTGDDAIWEFQWRAPDEIESPVFFWIAANAGNDDQSPFGDAIHYKTMVVDPD